MNPCLASEKATEKQNLETSKSIYSKIDSVNIEYWLPAQGYGFLFTLKEYQLNIRRKRSAKSFIISNRDSVLQMNNLVESLFISGKEKTEIGRTYKTSLSFSEQPVIIVSIFNKDKITIEHMIYLSLETCIIEFSPTFKRFYSLLDELTEMVDPKK